MRPAVGPVLAGGWLAGDPIGVHRACASLASVEAVVEQWEAGVTHIQRPPEDCWQVMRAGQKAFIPARLIQRADTRTYQMPDGVTLEVWLTVDRDGDAGYIALPVDAGPHEGA